MIDLNIVTGVIMEFLEVMKKRHSSRDFKKDEIPEETLKKIVEIAAMSPSWENSQPWNVYIATGETLETIREAWIAENDKKIKGSADMNPGHRTNFSERGQKNMADLMDSIEKFDDDKDLENFNHVQHILFNSPAIVYLALPKDYTGYSLYDLGGFGMSLMLAATELGVDSIPAYELIKYPYILRDNLPIPEDEDIIMGIALGHESEEHINEYDSPRLDLDEILKIN